MHKFLSLVFLVCSFISGIQAQDLTEGPKPNIEITFNGESYTVPSGETLTVDGHEIIARPSKILTFDYGALSFDYPHFYAYEYERDLGYQGWYLDGTDHLICYYVFDIPIDLDDFLDEIIGEFGKKNTRKSNKTFLFNNYEFEGRRVIVNLLGQQLTFDLFEVETSDGKTHFMGFQDTKGEDGSDSPDGIKTLQLLNKTLKVN